MPVVVRSIGFPTGIVASTGQRFKVNSTPTLLFSFVSAQRWVRSADLGARGRRHDRHRAILRGSGELRMSKESQRRGARQRPRKSHHLPRARTAAAAVLAAEAGMTKTSLLTTTARDRAGSRRTARGIAKPTIVELYEQVADIVRPLELELRYAELDELVSLSVNIMWTFVGVLARAHGYTDFDWDAAELSFRHAIDE
jgi:hypothetical protein